MRACIRPGRDVRVIDVSRGGALVQSTSRLLPGSGVELLLKIGTHRWVASGHVVRCRVWALALEERVRYRAAIHFARPIDPAVERAIGDVARESRTDCGGYEVPLAGSPDPR